MTTQTTFDLAGFTRATEERDAQYVLGMYADDAELRIIDRNNPPRSPQIFHGKPEIQPYIEDVFSRDMTHKIVNPVLADDRVALTEECQYPDGTNVLSSCSAELRDGVISRQSIIQVWDE